MRRLFVASAVTGCVQIQVDRPGRFTVRAEAVVPGPLKGLRAEIHRGGSVPFYGEETGTWYSNMTKKGRVYGCLARAMTVAEKLEKRLSSLRVEFESGQKMLADLEAKQASLRETLLRISGAIQVLEEGLGQPNEPGEDEIGETAQGRKD